MGPVPYIALIATLTVTSHLLVVLLSFLGASFIPLLAGGFYSGCSVGFSAVIFALKVVLNVNSPGTQRVAGIAVPTKVSGLLNSSPCSLLSVSDAIDFRHWLHALSQTMKSARGLASTAAAPSCFAEGPPECQLSVDPPHCWQRCAYQGACSSPSSLLPWTTAAQSVSHPWCLQLVNLGGFYSGCSVGFSAVIFGLKVVLHVNSPGTQHIAGFAVPAKVSQLTLL